VAARIRVMPEPLDTESLGAWAVQQGLIDAGEQLHAEPIGEGHSNLTYQITRVGDSHVAPWILRRPPYGPLLPTAHDVVREYRVMELLRTDTESVRVPELVGLCADSDVLGAPFYLMNKVPGVVVRNQLPDFLESHENRQALGLDLARALAQVHSVKWQPFVDAGLGKPSGYLERQLRRWTGQREGIQATLAAAGSSARELPDYDILRDWLGANIPDEVEPAVVHGDYKLDNVIVNEQGLIVAVVDWEMATVGDPRADLGYLLSFWPEPGITMPLGDLFPPTAGFPSRGELVAQWALSSGRPTPGQELRWFEALALWKLAILLEASYHRWLAGMSDDDFFSRLEIGVPALLARAREVAHV